MHAHGRALRDGAGVRKLAGDANFDRSLACTNEAKSCAAATGCWAGGELMKGFGSALSR